jgi:two-component system cell cycle sensor histidine kinase/response regulator CckA
VINGYADFALGNEELPEAVRDDMRCVRESGRKAAALTRQLLAFSRRQVLDMRPVNLDDVVKQSERMYRRLLPEDVQLVCVPSPQPWKVMADPGQIDQILINLVVNARDALGSGGMIVLETSNLYLDQAYAEQVPDDFQAGEYVMLAVSDTGAGIPKDILPRIFEPFFTTKARDKGTGLGLSTVYGIVKQMRGHIWVYTEPQKGTTFKIYLPRYGGDEVAAAPEHEEVAAPATGMTVLLIEDDNVLSRLCARMLTMGGYKVLEASTADEAMKLAQQHPEIGVLLVDVVLAGTTGPQVVERLERVRPGVTTLYMSGYTEHASLERGDLSSGASFIQKPFTKDLLLDRLAQALGQRQEA